jgi:polyisoprenyl-teichoic acid--peptidoglycan teichoic acid transferase
MPDHDSPQHPTGPGDRSSQRPERGAHGSPESYLERRRRQAARAKGRSGTSRSTSRRAASRYEAYSAPRSTRTRRHDARAQEHPAAVSPLQAEFDMARAVQASNRTPAARFRTLRRKRWFWPLVGVPGIVMMVAVLALSPVMWSAFQAYRNVTVDSVEHLESAFVPQMNVQGTPELVARPAGEPNPGWDGSEPINVLLLGVDIAAGGASRTDTIILVNIDPGEKTATMMSIPRDLKVVIPGYGVHKINAAFALGEFNEVQGGGAGLTIRTIESNLGIPIHGFVQIDFQGFIDMIDTVGGVVVDVPYPLRDDAYPDENYRYQRIYFPAGWQHLDGEAALVYARTRHQDGDSMRSARQQQVLMALRDQAVSLDLITRMPTLIRQFGDSVRTDIPINDALRIAQVGIDIPRDSISSVSMLPALYEDPGLDGIYYLSADWDIATDIFTEFAGEPIKPPGAAIADPDYSATIMILNGTTNTGLAGRVGTTLEQNGFWNVSVDYAEKRGNHARSLVIDHDSNLATSAMITNLIGVGADTIVLGDPDPDTYDGTDQYASYDIVIMLGNDAPDPAGDQWSLEDYQRETGQNEPSGVAPTEVPAPATTVEAAPPGEERELDAVDEDDEG